MLEWSCWILMLCYQRLTNKRKKKGTVDLCKFGWLWFTTCVQLLLIYRTIYRTRRVWCHHVIRAAVRHYFIWIWIYFFLSAYMFQMEKDTISFIGVAVTIDLLYLPSWVALFFSVFDMLLSAFYYCCKIKHTWKYTRCVHKSGRAKDVLTVFGNTTVHLYM